MTKKRKLDPRVDSSCPDAKLRSTDWMPLAQQFLDVLSSIRDEIRGIAQVKSTVEVLAEKFSKLDEKVENILNKSKYELKEEIKEVVKLEMQGNIGKSDGVQLDNKYKQSKVIYDDYAKAPQRSDAPPFPRSPRFRLKIISRMSDLSYKGRPVHTHDGRDVIEVEMRDGDNLIAPDHPLASVTVKLVLIDAENSDAITKTFWSTEEFRNALWKQESSNVMKNHTFTLNGGRASQPKVIITQGTVRKEIMLAVIMVDEGSERVLEGISNTFKVQEAKTAKSEKNKEHATNCTGKMCNPVGQAPCWNDQRYLPRQNMSQPMQHGNDLISRPQQRYTNPQATTQQHHCGSRRGGQVSDPYGQHYQQDQNQKFREPTSAEGVEPCQEQVCSCPYHNLPPSSWPATNAQIVGNGRGAPFAPQHSEQHIDPTYEQGNNDLEMSLNPSQKRSYSSTSQINAPQINSRLSHHTQIGGKEDFQPCQMQLFPPSTSTEVVEHGKAENGQEKFLHGQPQNFPETCKAQVISGQGQGISSPHPIVPPSSFPAKYAQSVGQEETTQQGQKKFFPEHSSAAAKNGQAQLNSSKHHSITQPGVESDLQISLNPSQKLPYLSTSQMNATRRDLWSSGHSKIGGGQGQVSHSTHHTIPLSALLDINARSVAGQGEHNYSQHHSRTESEVVLQMSLNQSQNIPCSSTSQINAPQRDSWPSNHTGIGGYASQGQLNSHQHHNHQQQANFLGEHALPMGQDKNGQDLVQHGQSQIFPDTGQGQVLSSMHLNFPPSSFRDINAQSVGQDHNFPQSQRQISPLHISIEPVKNGHGELNSPQHHSLTQPEVELNMSLNPSQKMPYSSTSQINAQRRDSMSSRPTQIGGNEKRPFCLEPSASQVTPPQNLLLLPISNSSHITEDNYGLSMEVLDHPLFTPEYNNYGSENIFPN